MNNNEIPPNSRRKMESLLAMSRSENESESSNAESALNRMLREHGLRIEDIDPLELTEFRFPCPTKWEEKLLLQVVSMITNTFNNTYWKPSPQTVLCKLTAVQGVDVERSYRHYRKAWKEELEVFYGAFIQKNNIFGNPSDDDLGDRVPPTDEEMYRRRAMAEGIRKTNAFRELE